MSNLKIVKTDSLKLKSRGATSRYAELMSKISELKAGESFVSEIPKGVDPGAHRNRLGMRIRYFKPTVAAGCYVTCRLTEDMTGVAVSCVKGEKPKSNAGRKPGTKNKPKPAPVPKKQAAKK